MQDPRKGSKGVKESPSSSSLRVGVSNEWGVGAGGSRRGGGGDADFFAMNVIPGTPMDEGGGFGFPRRGGGMDPGGRLAPSPGGGRSQSGSDASGGYVSVGGGPGTGGWWDRISWSSSRPGSSSTQRHA